MARPRIEPDLAAAVLLDAVVHGDKTAAERHGISVKTVQRYRKRSRTDDRLSGVVAEKSEKAQMGWHHARANLLRAGLRKARRIIDNADENAIESLPIVIDAITAVGNLEIALASLGYGHREPGPSPATDSGGERTEEDPDDSQGDGDGPPAGSDPVG